MIDLRYACANIHNLKKIFRGLSISLTKSDVTILFETLTMNRRNVEELLIPNLYGPVRPLNNCSLSVRGIALYIRYDFMTISKMT